MFFSVVRCDTCEGGGLSSVLTYNAMYTEETRRELGLNRQSIAPHPDSWNYVSLSKPPVVHSEEPEAAASIYRGIVPVQNLYKKDFAVNGSIVCMQTRSPCNIF